MTTRPDSARLLLFLVAGVIVAIVLWALRPIVILVGFSMLLAYGLDPLVTALERIPFGRRRRMPRGLASAIVVLALGALAGSALAFGIPRVISEMQRFIAGAPQALKSIVLQARTWADQRGLSASLAPLLDQLERQGSDFLTGLGGTLAGRFSVVLGGLGRSLEFALLPLLAFYLLADADAVRVSALGFLPAEARATFVRLGVAVDRALRSYVRGQALVCLVMAVAVGTALALLGFPLALLLGVLVGLAELIPFLGFAVAAIAVLVTGSTIDPLHALLGIAAYAGINWLIGTFVTPRVMGRYLRMHPFVVTVSVLAGGKLLGPGGALLALPGAAVIQSVIAELAQPDSVPAAPTPAPAE